MGEVTLEERYDIIGYDWIWLVCPINPASCFHACLVWMNKIMMLMERLIH